MKKSLLIILLVAIFVPMFASCGKNKTYTLSGLREDYLSISGMANVENDSNKIEIVTPSKLATKLYSTDMGKNAIMLEILAEDSIYFVNNYISFCSTEYVEVDKSTRNRIYSNLNNFKGALRNLDMAITDLNDVEIDTSDVLFQIRFRRLLETYVSFFNNAQNLHNEISSLYFENVLKGQRLEYLKNGEANFNASVAISRIDGFASRQLSEFALAMMEMNFCGESVIEDIMEDKTLKVDLTEYFEGKNKIAVSLNVENALVRAEVKKSEFYELSVRQENIEKVLNYERAKYNQSCKNIVYVDQTESSNETVLKDKRNVEAYKALLDNYNDIFAEIKTLIGD